MAKVTVEIPDRYIEAVKGLLMVQSESDENVEIIERAAGLLKESEKPLVIDTTVNGIFKDAVKDMKDFYIAIGAFALAQVVHNMKG